MSLMRKLVCTYNHWLVTYPYRLQAAQVCTVLALGDVLAQKLITKKKYDAERTVKFMSSGLMLGPACHGWYVFLDKIYGRSQTLKMALIKTATDQLFFAPLAMAVMFLYVHVVNGQKMEVIKKSFKEKYPSLLLNSYALWPAAQTINFTIIPLNFRVIFIQTLGAIWNTYLSWKIQKFED